MSADNQELEALKKQLVLLNDYKDKWWERAKKHAEIVEDLEKKLEEKDAEIAKMKDALVWAWANEKLTSDGKPKTISEIMNVWGQPVESERDLELKEKDDLLEKCREALEESELFNRVVRPILVKGSPALNKCNQVVTKAKKALVLLNKAMPKKNALTN